MNDSRLTIRRVHAQYLVPSDHPSPRRIKDRLDFEIRRSLSHVLSNAFSAWFSETDSSLWFVRRLEIDLAVNASGDAEHVARSFTRQLGRALGDTLQDGTDHNNVVRFSSPAEYLAHFLSDLAAGYAWGRWYYESFVGLRALPTSAALRTAVCNAADGGMAALLLLQNSELKNVLRALSRHDTKVILESLIQVVADDTLDSTEMARSLSPLLDADLLKGLSEWGRALYLYVSVAREQKERGLGATDAISVVLRCSAQRLREVAEGLYTTQAQAGSLNAQADRRDTLFGGVFLLLPLIDEIPLVEALHDWPHADEAAAISLVRFLLLIKCTGPEHGQRSFSDPLLRDLMLVPPTVSAEVLRDWQASVTTENIQNFLRTLVNWQRSQGRVTDQRCMLASTTFLGSPVSALIDEAQALWLVVQGYSACRSRKSMEVLREFLSRLEQEEGILLCDPTLLNRMATEFPTLKVLSFAEADRKMPNGEELSSDLSYLALPDSIQISPGFDLALSVAGQHVLRNFARRLPGFGQSNLPYLSINFLSFRASVDEETTRRVVRLSGPPLRLVLGITGMMRQTYRLSWLGECPFVLFEES